MWNSSWWHCCYAGLKEAQPWCQAVPWPLLSLVWALMEGEVLFEVPGVFQGLLPAEVGPIPVSCIILVPCLAALWLSGPSLAGMA